MPVATDHKHTHDFVIRCRGCVEDFTTTADPKHFVTFNVIGWTVQHSLTCRVLDNMVNCPFGLAIIILINHSSTQAIEALAGEWEIVKINADGRPVLIPRSAHD